MNQQSSIERVNGLFGGVMWLVFSIIVTASTAIGIVSQFNALNLVSYIVPVLICIAVWVIWVGARQGRVQRTGFTIISGILIARIVIACIVAVILACVGFALVVNDAAGVGIGLLVVTAIVFLLVFQYYRELRRVVVAIRDIIDRGSGNVRASMYVIVIMSIGAAGTLIGTVMIAQAGRMMSVITEYLWMVDETAYDIVQNALSYVGFDGKVIFASLLNCTVQIMSVVILCMMRNGLPEIVNNPANDPFKRLSQKTCPQCGAGVPFNAAFCVHCGASMTTVSDINRMPEQEQQNWQTVNRDSNRVQEQQSRQSLVPDGTDILRKENKAPAPTSVLRADGMLAGTGGSLNGKLIQLPDAQVITIGRDAMQCQIRIAEENSSISRRHCTVEYRKDMDAYILTDHSSNGVFVGGVQLPKGQPQMLGHGTEVALGDRREIFVVK